MIQYWYSLVKYKKRFDKILHIFPVRGHSFLPNDTDFARIEKIKRNHENVYTPLAWMDLVKEIYSVVPVSGDMIFDYKTHLSTFFKTNVTRNKRKYLISTYKVFEFCITHKHEVCVSVNMNGSTVEDFDIEKPNVQVTMPDVPMYSDSIPINSLKLADVKKLLKFIPEEDRAWYDELRECDERDIRGDDTDADD